MCCLLFAFALLFSMTPADLDAACTAIRCQRQENAGGCISQYGALQVAAAFDLPVEDVPRYDWQMIDDHIWQGVVLHAWIWHKPGEYVNPEGPMHSYFCLGDAWLPVIQKRIMRCWDADNPNGTWWDVQQMQEGWSGWGATR